MIAKRAEFVPEPTFKSFLGRLLNIRSEEWPRLMFLYGMALVALIGIGWGETIVVAAFLHQAGVQFLPWAFVISAVASITIWLVSLAVMAVMIRRMPRVVKDKRAAGPGGMAALMPRVQRPSYFRNLQQGLRIEIDEGKRQKQVDEIVETDFFQDLQAKARAIRTRTPRARPDAPAGDAVVSQP